MRSGVPKAMALALIPIADQQVIFTGIAKPHAFAHDQVRWVGRSDRVRRRSGGPSLARDVEAPNALGFRIQSSA